MLVEMTMSMFYIHAVEKDWQNIITKFVVEFFISFVEYITDL